MVICVLFNVLIIPECNGCQVIKYYLCEIAVFSQSVEFHT